MKNFTKIAVLGLALFTMQNGLATCANGMCARKKVAKKAVIKTQQEAAPKKATPKAPKKVCTGGSCRISS